MDTKDIRPDDVLDCVGLKCPMPIFKTSNKIKELSPGQVLEVQADDEGIVKDMPAWCKTTGNEYLGIEEKNGEYKLFVRKK